MDVVTLALAKKYTDEHSGSGTTVIANPTLAGTESTLVGLQVGEVKYKVNDVAYSPFPSEFVVTGTLQEFGQSIINYSGFKAGKAWYGGIECSDLPCGMIQVECKVTALRDTTDYIENLAVIEIYSSEVAPFYWTYNTNSWEKGTGYDDWKYVAQIDESKFPTVVVASDVYDVKVKKSTQWNGWEFYVEKDQEIIANPSLAGTEADLTGIQVGDTKYKVSSGSEPSAYLSDASVTDNVLKIQNKSGQDVVSCSVNYTLDNDKVKAVLSDSEKETLLSGITGTTWIAAQTNISTLQSGKQDKLTAGTNITIDENNVISATGGSTPTNMLTTDTAQTVSGVKTFTVPILFAPQDNTFIKLSAAADTYSDTLKLISGNSTGTVAGSTELQLFYNYNTGRKIIMPATDGDVELGRTGNQLKNIFVSGYIKDGDTTGSHSISVAQMAAKSTVSASSTGTSTTEAKYITVDGTEYKLSAPQPEWIACPIATEPSGYPCLPDMTNAGTYELRYFDSTTNTYYTSTIYYPGSSVSNWSRGAMCKATNQSYFLQLTIENGGVISLYKINSSFSEEEDQSIRDPGLETSTKVFYRKLL